ncbi:uncharacterized protein [Panulirus ornatus]|uniref:uncharacterized protein isoform X2 n=1 Tax=Panulirus ornatus TaxID=150431 RepID=UPI003A8769A9
MDGRRTSRFLILLLLVFSIGDVSHALHITRVGVPTPVAVGEGGWLECEFVDEGETIYALKWYLGLDEFYRWTPAEEPQVKTFPVRGDPLKVDLAASDKGRVRVFNVSLGAAGVFRCEVSAEAPSFHTESQTATMTVVDLPDEKPRITGAQGIFQTHEEVLLNCSSPGSQPPATLSFYVNNEQADPAWVVHYPPQEDPGTGLETAVLGLRFLLRPRLLRQGVVVVKCSASILNLYWSSTEAFLPTDVPYHASVMKGRAAEGREVVEDAWIRCLLLAAFYDTQGIRGKYSFSPIPSDNTYIYTPAHRVMTR